MSTRMQLLKVSLKKTLAQKKPTVGYLERLGILKAELGNIRDAVVDTHDDVVVVGVKPAGGADAELNGLKFAIVVRHRSLKLALALLPNVCQLGPGGKVAKDLRKGWKKYLLPRASKCGSALPPGFSST
jgi:hypothetical protein